MFDYNQIREAFNKAREHAMEIYNENNNLTHFKTQRLNHFLYHYIEYTDLSISDNSHSKVLADASEKYNRITAYFPIINSDLQTEDDVYKLMLHEFAHIISYRVYPDEKVGHGKGFKEIAHNLGLSNVTPYATPPDHILYRIAVPDKYNPITKKTTKRYYYVSKQWLNENPEYNKYVIKTIKE